MVLDNGRIKNLLYFVLTTGKCNLDCRYCGGSFPEDKVPWKISYEISSLKELVEADPEPIIAFYGGEPLLNVDVVKRIMGSVKAKKFVIQTNGTLVGNLPSDYWKRMDAALLSIDGRNETTDFYRGLGVYRKVLEAANEIRAAGFNGDLIARMAVSEKTDIYEDVMHLLELGIFDHIHWQLDVGWSDSWKDFDGWCEESYKPGIVKLVEAWKAELRNGRVLGLVPLLGILKRLRDGGLSPPCGSGCDSIAIMPDGQIRACPISFDTEWASVGILGKDTHASLEKRLIVGECNDCVYLKGCGGRCLYMNRERFWGKDGFEKVCALTKFTINKITTLQDEVIKALESGKITSDELDYPKYNNSTEIVP